MVEEGKPVFWLLEYFSLVHFLNVRWTVLCWIIDPCLMPIPTLWLIFSHQYSASDLWSVVAAERHSGPWMCSVTSHCCALLMLPLCRYMCSLSFFHYSEYLVTAIINPHSLSLDSFLLNHSVEYTLAAASSWVEFIVEKLTVPGGSLGHWITGTTQLSLRLRHSRDWPVSPRCFHHFQNVLSHRYMDNIYNTYITPRIAQHLTRAIQNCEWERPHVKRKTS